jgi:hypothetical protein|tara:strand:- start:24659 stop:25522 length:864 start_codon:yes stop_codon:yes gene_type:complete
METFKELRKMITALTTFHKAGLDLYGQRFIDSFAKNVDKKIKLLVYAENCTPVNPDINQITIIDSKELVKLNQFKSRWGNVPKANGECPFPEKRPRDHHKKFKWDAVRFANKVYAVFDAVERNNDKWTVWIDGDTYVHSPINYEQFQQLLPSDKWITFVGRGKGSQTWPECGFYGLNTEHDTCKRFLNEFERMYQDADNGIFKLDEWHDSYVFGKILNQLMPIDKNFHDYSQDIYNKTAKTGGGGHPLINSVLGNYFDHMKGDRKNKGKSQKKDLLSTRAESYWNEV